MLLLLLFLMMSCNHNLVPSSGNKTVRIREPENISRKNDAGLEQEKETDESPCEEEIQSVFNKAVCFALDEKIEADFNGDGYKEEAIFSINENDPFIKIRDSQSNKQIRIGTGSPLKGIGEDFRWVDYWGLLYDSVSFEILIQDGEVIGDTLVRLSNPSLFLRQSEFGGGLITFHDNQYRWIHQAD